MDVLTLSRRDATSTLMSPNMMPQELFLKDNSLLQFLAILVDCKSCLIATEYIFLDSGEHLIRSKWFHPCFDECATYCFRSKNTIETSVGIRDISNATDISVRINIQIIRCKPFLHYCQIIEQYFDSTTSS
ncbi:hypothetical protein DINM_005517 [Dirofilaria immitis]|nr:hypothetical protein [Dirofilaria immitis]